MRLYGAQTPILDGSYRLPAVQRVRWDVAVRNPREPTGRERRRNLHVACQGKPRRRVLLRQIAILNYINLFW